jgi:hypothetical protein
VGEREERERDLELLQNGGLGRSPARTPHQGVGLGGGGGGALTRYSTEIY